MQTTLLGVAIAFILALIAALVGPYFIDWSQFRPQFEAEATRVIGAPVRVDGALDARLLPTPSLRLRSVMVGGANDLGKIRADKLDVEFNLGSLMRGELRASELTINGAAVDLGLNAQGKVDLPASTGPFSLGALAIDRVNLTGRIALHDAASRSTLELNDIAFGGDVRSLAGAIRGDGNFLLTGVRYPFRIVSGQTTDGSGTRVHLTIDPGERALSVDLDGVLSFDARAPRFDGAVTLAAPVAIKAGGDAPQTPWKISGKLKADASSAKIEALETSYGAEETALKLTGSADIAFGASPSMRALLSAKQLDADRIGKADNATEPLRLMPGLRRLIAAIPQAPMPSQIDIGADQIMLGGRPIQNLSASLRGDAQSWTVDRLELRAPGSTRVTVSGAIAQAASAATFKGALSVDAADPDTLSAWMQGRSEIAYRSQKPLRVAGSIDIAADHIAIDNMKAEIEGGVVEGRVAFADGAAGGASRLDAVVKADRLDLDAATAFVRSLAGQAEWPDETRLSLDIATAISAGQELRPLIAQIGYGPKTISLDKVQIGNAGSVKLEGAGAFDRVDATGKLSLNASSASLAKMTALVAPFAPAFAARLNAVGASPGAAQLKLSLALDKNPAKADRANARAVLDIDSPDIKGVMTITAIPAVAAMRGIDLDALAKSEIGLETKLSSAQGKSLLVLLGLDRAIAAGEGPASFEGSADGTWRAPLRVKARFSGAQLDADVQGTTDPWSEPPKASVNLAVRRANLTPLFDLKPSDTSAQTISLSSRLTLANNKLDLADIDSTIAGARVRGRLGVTLGDEKVVDGELGMDTLDLAPAFAMLIGAAGHDSAEPLSSGLSKGWRGQVAFQSLRGALPGSELRPISGTIKGDGQSFTIDGIKAGLGGGEATADINARQTANGVALDARIQFANVDGAALHYRALPMPAGRTSLKMTLSSQGRSASALSGAISGSGLVTLESARIAGLDPRAFDTGIRASDSGQATDDNKLRQIIEPVLAAGTLSVASAQIPFSLRDGRLRVGATTLDGEGARAIVSGGYDIAADQADIRASLSSTTTGAVSSRPELQLFATGTPDGLNRTLDVASLSSWLAVRAIDRETRRLDSIERGEAPSPTSPPALPASIPAPAATQPPADKPPEVAAPALPDLPPLVEVPVPGRDPRRIVAPKPRVVVPRPPAPVVSNMPDMSGQIAPLPPTIDVRPAPAPRPKPRPPLVLTPPPASLPRPLF